MKKNVFYTLLSIIALVLSSLDTVEGKSWNRPPVAEAGRDQVVQQLSMAQMDGSRSFDPDGSVIYYHWELIAAPENGLGEIWNSGEICFFRPDAVGTWIFKLVVSDGKLNSDPDVVRILVREY